MAYQNVGSPRFYMNIHEYFHRIGKANYGDDAERILTLPVLHHRAKYTTSKSTFGTMGLQKNFLALLNCDASKGLQVNDTPLTEIAGSATEDGFRIGTFTFNPTSSAKITGEAGSLILGIYYDLDAPNVSLTMEREYASNVKETTSYLGSSFSNTYSMPNYWGDRSKWEVGGAYRLGSSARRIWNLSWSFLELREVLGVNQLYSGQLNTGGDITSGYLSSDINSSNNQFSVANTTDPTFYNQVLRSSLFGQIPFIFQPNYNSSDSTNEGGNAPDQFAICKIKNKSIKVTQTAPELYNMSLTIEEVW